MPPPPLESTGGKVRFVWILFPKLSSALTITLLDSFVAVVGVPSIVEPETNNPRGKPVAL